MHKGIFIFLFLLYSISSVIAIGEKQDSMYSGDGLNNNDSSLVYRYVELSRLYSNSDIKQSIIQAEEAIDIAQNSGDEELLAYALFNAGNAYFYQGMYETATGYFYEYLNIQKQTAKPSGIAYALTNIGAIRIKMLDFKNAKQSFLKGLNILEDLVADTNQPEVKAQIPNLLNNIGIVYQNLHQFDSALWYYNRALQFSTFVKDHEYLQASIYNNIGGLFLDNQYPDSAFISLNKAMDIRLRKQDLAGQAASFNRLADYYLAKGDHQEALDHYYSGLRIASDIGSMDLQSLFTEKLYSYYKQTGKADSALAYYEHHHHFLKMINHTETLMELTRLELTSQFKEKEKLAQIEQEKLNTIYVFAALLLLLLLFIFILLYYLMHNRVGRLNLEKNNLALSQQNAMLEKENLQKELEIRNKELTTHVMGMIRKNEIISQIVEVLSSNMDDNNESMFHRIIKDLNQIQDESIWKEFELRYQQVHNEFYDNLQQISPNLTTNERRLCAFLRLNMTTKDIASITGQTIRSIEVARTRLRKKLEITNSETSLVEFLSSL